jgi:Flp pilus assembly protein TadG
VAERAPRGDAGAALVESLLVTILVVACLLGVLQIGLYLHIRNVAAASAAEGARLAANADADPADGADRAESTLVGALGERTGGRFRCATSAPDATVEVRCTAALPVFFLPGVDVLPVDVAAHALDERAL